MLKALRPLIDIALHGQTARLMVLARAYKDTAVDEAKAQAAAVAMTAALALLGMVFVTIAVLIGFAALYYVVAEQNGPLAGFAAAGGAALLIAILVFVVVAARAKGPPRRSMADIKSEAKDAIRQSERAAADLGSRVQREAEALGRRSVDAAADVVRDGSRETVFALLAATAVLGVLIGRRR